MRLDPKYFGRFMAICAALTVVVIAWSTFRYQNSQERTFRSNLEQVDLDQFHLHYMRDPGSIPEMADPDSVSEPDSVQLSELIGSPLVIDFWATWSDRSRSVHRELGQLVQKYPDLKVLAVAVRDGDSQIRSYIEAQAYPFIWLTGTDLYHELQVPGVPSLIFLDSAGEVFDYQVGEDPVALVQKIESLLQHE